MKRSTTNHFRHHKLRLAVVSLALLGFVALPFARVNAESLSDKISNLQAQIEQSQAEAHRLHGEADSLQNALNTLTAEKNALQAQVDLSQARYDQLTEQIEQNEIKLAKQQSVLSATISDLSVESTTSPIELLAGSPSIGDFIDRQEYRTSVQEQVEAAINTVQALKKELASQRKEVETVLAEQKVQRDQLAAKEAEQAQLLAATQAQEANYQARAEDLRAQKAEAEAALRASLSSRSYATSPAGYVNSGAVVGLVGSTGMSTGPHLHLEVRTSDGSVTDPSPYIRSEPVDMPPAYISQYFGNPDPIYARGYHPGTDYAANFGAYIYAIDSGMMYRGCSSDMIPGSGNAYGYVAIVEHSNGTRSVNAHMSGGQSCN